jgi:hypothetical protein
MWSHGIQLLESRSFTEKLDKVARASQAWFSFVAGFLFQSVACSVEWPFQMLALFG